MGLREVNWNCDVCGKNGTANPPQLGQGYSPLPDGWHSRVVVDMSEPHKGEHGGTHFEVADLVCGECMEIIRGAIGQAIGQTKLDRAPLPTRGAASVAEVDQCAPEPMSMAPSDLPAIATDWQPVGEFRLQGNAGGITGRVVRLERHVRACGGNAAWLNFEPTGLITIVIDEGLSTGKV